MFAILLFAVSFPFLRILESVWSVDADGVNSTTHNLAVWDFANLWSGGRLVSDGHLATLFDPAGFAAWQRQMFSPRLEPHEWSYPPSLLLLAVPLAQLPLLASYAVWTVGSLLLLGWAMAAAGAGRWATVLAVTSPAMIFNVALGQNGALTAAAMIAGLQQMPRRPVVAGVLMGLLSIKPHLGILLPVCAIASGNWRTVISAVATIALVVIATGALFGWENWALFLSVTRPMMQNILEAPWFQGYQVNAITVFMLARAFGAGVIVSYAIQWTAAAAAVVLVWRAWRCSDVDLSMRVALTIGLTFLTTPYAWTYDLVSLGAAIALVAARRGWKHDIVLLLAWVFPGFAQVVTRALHLPLGSLVIMATLWAIWRVGKPSN
ncbi:MAG: glycosyltransferase family 87 protein [Methylococcaceae bacterium]|nr:glycosyltransferase family 87 protein [Methylococcaceae bacterium]